MDISVMFPYLNTTPPGPVFGSKNYFSGLAVFFDTYSNENGEHAVSAALCLQFVIFRFQKYRFSGFKSFLV